MCSVIDDGPGHQGTARPHAQPHGLQVTTRMQTNQFSFCLTVRCGCPMAMAWTLSRKFPTLPRPAHGRDHRAWKN